MASGGVCVLVLFLALVAAPRNLQARSLYAKDAHLPFDSALAQKQQPSSSSLLLGFPPQVPPPLLPQVLTASLDSHKLEIIDRVVPFPLDADTSISEPDLRTSNVNAPIPKPVSSLSLQDQAVLSSIPSLLKQNGLPVGLLPSSVASYSIMNDGDFIVCLQEACYVDFDHEVYYAQTITGTLSYGSITNLSGIQAKEAFFWVPVTAIRTDIPSSNFIYFNVGPMSKKMPISQFETIPTCKAKAMSL